VDARPPRFRRLPFVRDGISDLGRASAPRMTAPHMLPSTGQTVSASATLILSRLNSPPHTIAVYASPPPSPAQLQHSLPGGPLRPYPRGTFTRWNAPASPGAPDPVFPELIHGFERRPCCAGIVSQASCTPQSIRQGAPPPDPRCKDVKIKELIGPGETEPEVVVPVRRGEPVSEGRADQPGPVAPGAAAQDAL